MRSAAHAALLAVLLVCAQAGADAPAELRHNPFSRPALAERGTEPGAPAALDAVELPLRGTLSAGPASIANVGGELLAVGDEYRGWKLVAIGEGEAQFASGQQRITVPVAGNEKEMQDARKPRKQ